MQKEKAKAAKNLLERLRRGETVGGGLGERLDFEAEFRAAGFTARELRRMSLIGRLTEAELGQLLKAVHAADMTNKAAEREARRIIRAPRRRSYERERPYTLRLPRPDAVDRVRALRPPRPLQRRDASWRNTATPSFPILRHVLANCPKAKSASIHDRCKVRYGADSRLNSRELRRGEVLSRPATVRFGLRRTRGGHENNERPASRFHARLGIARRSFRPLKTLHRSWNIRSPSRLRGATIAAKRREMRTIFSKAGAGRGPQPVKRLVRRLVSWAAIFIGVMTLGRAH